jgi:ribonuclease HI
VEPTSTEAMATMVAIQLARDMGLMQVQLEGDAKVVIDVMLSSTPDWSRWGHLTKDIRTSLKSSYA